jgi:predicted nuclease with TOPRIM domain
MNKIVLTMWILSASAILTIFAASTDGNKHSIEQTNHLESKIDEMFHNLSACINFTDKIEAEKSLLKSELDNCRNNAYTLNINLSVTTGIFENEIAYLRSKIDEHQTKLNFASREITHLEEEKNIAIDDLETKYQILASNSAHNICCKAKIDNPAISYYDIKNNKIICNEYGTNILSC